MASCLDATALDRTRFTLCDGTLSYTHRLFLLAMTVCQSTPHTSAETTARTRGTAVHSQNFVNSARSIPQISYTRINDLILSATRFPVAHCSAKYHAQKLSLQPGVSAVMAVAVVYR